MSLLQLAQLATLQNKGFALDGCQAPDHLEAITGSFQHKEVLGRGVPSGPGLELSQWHSVEDFFAEGLRRSLTPEHRRSEAVGMSVKADHSLDRA